MLDVISPFTRALTTTSPQHYGWLTRTRMKRRAAVFIGVLSRTTMLSTFVPVRLIRVVKSVFDTTLLAE